jgi:hypothetical protein
LFSFLQVPHIKAINDLTKSSASLAYAGQNLFKIDEAVLVPGLQTLHSFLNEMLNYVILCVLG